ncbi:trans-aconitate 2-methyltransferase [Streptomyces sp. PT12]|uniref:class I SAM-dependent methyltransferase n=1 Tax=Streptomyces sp. PT12 TaxID=1510197 RepID=UPI000DE1EEF6|nr:class I SAM-dependent methyltransferase [Streptomyces sp. PT12]RBM12323.1 hypothetical protein DEH69_20105 [Streptomyces sp. PT12]
MAPDEHGDPLTSDAFYHELAERYDADVAAERRPYLDAVDALVCRGRAAPRRMLDIGCGPGVRGAGLARRLGAGELWLADSSAGMVRTAKRGVPWARVVRADLADAEQCGERLPGGFDLITCLGNVLGHMPEKARVAALRTVGALLAPGGSAVLDLNNRYNAAQYGVGAVAANMAKDLLGLGGGDYVTRRRVRGRVIATPVHLTTPREARRLMARGGRTVRRTWFVHYARGCPARGPLSGQIVMEVV